MSKRTYPVFFFFLSIILSIILFAAPVFAGGDDVWREIDDSAFRRRPVERPIKPDVYRAFNLNKAALQEILGRAPVEFSNDARLNRIILSFPRPDGSLGRFRIENSPIMEPALAAQYPEIQTFRGQGIDDPAATVRFDFTPDGFHAMILSAHETIYIDPFAKGDTDNYVAYHKTDLRQTGEKHVCLVKTSRKTPFKVKEFDLFRNAPDEISVTNGSQLRTYRLALAATGEYTAVFGGTVSGATAAMTTTMNRVNGVYERDVAVRMVLIANNNLIVYTNAMTDPYTNDDGILMLDENQANIDTVIGAANYDIGHVFSTGGGGIAALDSPCANGVKAQGVTGLDNPTGDGFDIDFVAHEMGHQFGGNHTFNTSCGGNREPSAAYEPGSGITIMAYAGVCGAQDLALHSIDTFHVRSLEEIVAFKESGGTCGAATATGNTPPTVSVVGGATFNIPKMTPFTLTATGSDTNGDTITYDWQEYRLGASTSAIPNSDLTATRPTMRPYLPTSGARTIPQLTYILNNANVPPSTYPPFTLLTGELLPQAARTVPFQVIARDNRASGGGINTATTTLNVTNDGPFNITSQNAAVTYQGNSVQTVTWNVANTTAAPINAANVKISYSTNGGTTFPVVLNHSTTNDGTQSVIIPAGNTTTARIKVEAVGNIFFDINGANITVSGVAPAAKSRADFDGDGRTDLSVFRPTEGNWYLNRSTAGFQVLNWGIATDELVPGDYDGDGKTDVAVFRPADAGGIADFYVLNSNGFVYTGAEWGLTGDIPVVGDYDNDNKADIAVYRPADNTWYVLKSGGGIIVTVFGQAGDVPVAGDFDGDGKSDLTVNRGGTWMSQLSGGGTLNFAWGTTGDILVPADYDNDNKTDIAVYRPGEGNWYIRKSSDSTTTALHWGNSTDIPVPGDYDGDGADDLAIYRNGTWHINRSTSGALVQSFGLTTDKAIPTAYIP